MSNKRCICHFEGAALIRGQRLIEGGAYLIFVVFSAALIRGWHLMEEIRYAVISTLILEYFNYSIGRRVPQKV